MDATDFHFMYQMKIIESHCWMALRLFYFYHLHVTSGLKPL